MSYRVVGVEVEETHRTALRTVLEREGCEVVWVDQHTMSELLVRDPPDVAVLGAGADACAIRRLAPGTPIVGSREERLLDQLRGALGVPEELRFSGARVFLARGQAHRASSGTCRPGDIVNLTRMECALLRYLYANLSRAVPTQELRQKVWGYRPSVESRTVSSAVYRLRRKIEANPKDARNLLSIYGVGYRLALGDGQVTPPVTTTTVPAARDSFVGRSRELEELRATLRDARLVTLLGIGGVGKSRLALELLRGPAMPFPGGTWWVDLTDAATEPDVLGALARTLDVQLRGSAPRQQLGEGFRRRDRLLLVLDNGEHLVDVLAPILADWLDHCPALSVLVTSRLPMDVHGEHLFRLDPLPVPAADESGLCDNAAVALLADRMKQQRPGFRLDSNTTPHAARIVRLIDGLPLAIELAAGGSGALPLAWISDEIDRSVDLLDAVPETPQPRRRGIRAALDWSWRSLDQEERALLVQLGVFEGGFDATAARDVVDPPGGLEVLRHLVDKSLVKRSGDRLTLLLIVQRYVRDQATVEVLTDARDRHARYFASIEVSSDDLANALAACRWAIAQRKASLAGALAYRSWQWLHRRGQVPLGGELAEAVLALDPEPKVRAQMLLIWLVVRHFAGELGEEGSRLYEECIRIAEEHDDQRLLVRLYVNYIQYLPWDTQYADAVALSDEAIRLAEAIGEHRCVGIGLQCRSVLRKARGDYTRAEADLIRALEVYRTADERHLAVAAMNAMALNFIEQGRYAEAEPWLNQGRVLAREVGERRLEGGILGNLATIAFSEGRDVEAAAMSQQAEQILAECGDVRIGCIYLINAGIQLTRARRFREARGCLERALLTFQQNGFKAYEGHAWSRLGVLHAKQNRTAAREHCFARAEALLREVPRPALLVHLLADWAVLGPVEASQERLDQAEALARRANVQAASPAGQALAEARRTLLGARAHT